MKAGYNKLDITPQSHVNMAGYNRPFQSQGILDPIEINTMAFSYQEKLFIISILDSIIIENSVIKPVKNKICQQYNLSEDQIIIGCIHTHSAPAYFKPFFEKVAVEKELQNKLILQFIDSIEKAIDSMVEVSLTLKHTMIDGIYGNRNSLNGESDKNAYIINFMNIHSKETIFSLISLACHPTILNQSNQKLSADLFGQIRLEYQKAYQHPCMIINGCCGDVSTRFYRKGSGEEELKRTAYEIFSQLKDSKPIETSISTLKISSYQNDYLYTGKDEFITQTIPQLEQYILSHPESKDIALKSMLLNNLKFKRQKSPMTLSLYSHIIYLGDILFITLPGDITAIFAKRIREAFKDKVVIIMGYCENYSNYFVYEKDYGLYFETYISRLEKGNADDFINNTIEAAKELCK